ncbi:MAG: hypothetical protein DCC71_23680 [Proteobacteria bacterium]|nr:MAG: hypothetical protein DCC71_23680 [Pseudomonadota bacterium]
MDPAVRSLVLSRRARAAARLALALLLTAALGCATFEPLPAYPVRPARAYASAQTRGALAVAIEPVLDGARSERSLGTDLLRDEGLLGVLVVVENRDAAASWLLLPDAVSLAAVVPIAPEVPDVEGASILAGRVGEAADFAIGMAGLALPPVGLLYLGFATLSGRSVSQSRFVRHRLLRTALTAHTVSPGERVHGLVSFPLEMLRASGAPARLAVELTDPATQAVERFEFALDVPREDAR